MIFTVLEFRGSTLTVYDHKPLTVKFGLDELDYIPSLNEQ